MSGSSSCGVQTAVSRHSRRQRARARHVAVILTTALALQWFARGRGFCGLQGPLRRSLPSAAPALRAIANQPSEADGTIYKQDRIRERQLSLFLRHSFQEADKDKDGEMSKEEFLAWTLQESVGARLQELGVGLSAKALGQVYDMLDRDGDGSLDIEEFVSGMSCIQDALSSSDLKQRFAIDGIVRRQESIRMSVSLLTGKVFMGFSAALGLAGLASFAGFLPAWWSTCIPAGTSALMLGTSVAESSGSWSKGSARYSAAQALEQAFRTEGIVADADIEKAFIPFGVGITGVAAGASAAIKGIIEEQREFGQGLFFVELLDAGDVAVGLLAVAAVVGASVTSDQAFRMRATLSALDEEDLFEERPKKEVLGRAEQAAMKRIKFQERAANVAFTLILCVLPLPFVDDVRGAPDLPTFFNLAAVVVSEAAAALAAVTFVLAELDFANAERSVATRSKNAALAELFYAQTSAEAAALPASTALSGAALGGAAFIVEVSHWAALAFPWPGAVAALRSAFGAVLTELEAHATWVQRGLATAAGRPPGSNDVFVSALRELSRVVREWEEDPQTEKIREDLLRLPVGSTQEFKALNRQDRRKVHLVASELGMSSYSYDRLGVRLVRVTNLGARRSDDKEGLAVTAFKAVRNEVLAMQAEGMPEKLRLAFCVTSLAGLTGAASPVVAGRLGAEFALPLVTSALAVFALQQERSGTVSAATAQKYAAGILQMLADANQLLAKAYMSQSLLPTVFAAATFTTTVSIIGFEGPAGHPGIAALAVLPALPVSLLAFVLSAWRLRRIVQYVQRASSLMSAKAPRCRVLERWYVWPMAAAAAFLLPCDVYRCLTLASAILMGGAGVIMASAAVQVATGDNFVARSALVCACADAWAQKAAKGIRFLPFESASAVVSALLATAIVEDSVALASAFPLASAAICLRALQLQNNATEGMREAQLAASSLQVPTCTWPWPPAEDEKVTSASSPHSIVMQPVLPAWRILLKRFDCTREQLQARPREKLRGEAKALSKRMVEGKTAQQEFGPDPAENAVQNVQRDLDELSVTRDTRVRGFSGTLTLLAALSVGCLLVPIIFASQADVVLPAAGAGLTLFTAAEESRARRLVTDAKIRACEINSVVSTMEVQLSASAPYRARLLAATGLTAVTAVSMLALEHTVAAGALSSFWLVPVLLAQALTAAWCAWPLQAVLHWTGRVRRTVSSSAQQPLEAMGLGPGTAAYGGPNFGSETVALPLRRKLWVLLFVAPAVLLAFLPPGRSFTHRAVASMAGGAGSVAFALFLAEVAQARAERMVATRATTAALTDAFANEGEQQSVLLPLASASSIALSALIAFLVELNLFSAAALTVLQTVTWVLAARKGVAAKYYTKGAMQVDAVTERPTTNET